MSDSKILQPEVIVFAGPNGSGKSTITRMAKTVGEYINADDIKGCYLNEKIKSIYEHYDYFELVWFDSDNTPSHNADL